MKTNRPFLILVVSLSILIPGTVGALLFLPQKTGFDTWIYWLPHLNGIINTTTSLILIAAFIAIRGKSTKLHKRLMSSALFLGVTFLISYLVYHASAESTLYGDINHDGILDSGESISAGGMRIFYLILLLAHIVLSVLVVPLVLMAFYFALGGQFEKHRRIVRFSFPIWLFVSVSGVFVYLLIRPFYLY